MSDPLNPEERRSLRRVVRNNPRWSSRALAHELRIDPEMVVAERHALNSARVRARNGLSAGEVRRLVDKLRVDA